jgi:hypothetical protein
VTLPPNPLAAIETGILRWYQGASKGSGYVNINYCYVEGPDHFQSCGISRVH